MLEFLATLIIAYLIGTAIVNFIDERGAASWRKQRLKTESARLGSSAIEAPESSKLQTAMSTVLITLAILFIVILVRSFVLASR